MKYDDSLDTFGVHGVGGTLGALLTGVFASTAINPAMVKNPMLKQLGIQAVGVGATIVYAVVVTWILLKVIDAVMGLRVKPGEEETGLDLTQHGEEAYHMVG
jgi:Amt family ammonium transporter